MQKYILINPQLKGSIKITVKAKTGVYAMEKLYKRLAQYILEPLKQNIMILRNTDTNNLSYYLINEKPKKSSISFTITRSDNNLPKQKELSLLDLLGGARKKRKKKITETETFSESESSSDSSEFELSPITHYKYFYIPDGHLLFSYYPKPISYSQIIIPKFTHQISPTISIEFSLIH